LTFTNSGICGPASRWNLKAGHLDEWTTGFRWVGALPDSFDYRTEMAYQLGTLGG
jgi:hypothetical protein